MFINKGTHKLNRLVTDRRVVYTQIPSEEVLGQLK